MKAREFIREADEDSLAINQFAVVPMVLGQIQRKLEDLVKKGKLKSTTISTELVLQYIRNSGPKTFDYEDLVKANEEVPAVKELIKNLTSDEITINLGHKEPVENPEDYAGDQVANPEQEVSSMAKRALKKRRQD